MNAMSPFFFESNQVRAFEISGEPWFIAVDVCAALEIENSRRATARLDADEKGVTTVNTLGGAQEVATINESGLYSLILTSRKPSAKRFRKWVTAEVLPAIRRTGSYSVQPAASAPAIDVRDPSQLATIAIQLIEVNRELERRAETAEAKAEAMAPTVAAYDRLATADGSLCLTDAAKTLGVQPRKLFAWTDANRWTYLRPGHAGRLAYQDKIQRGLMEHKITPIERPDGTEKIVTQARVTPKGLAALAKIFTPPPAPGDLFLLPKA